MRIFVVTALAISIASCAQIPAPSADQPSGPIFAENPNAQERAKQATYQFLIRNNVDPETATAALLNPTIMDTVMKEISARQHSAPQRSSL